ncbi:MAG: hypothetical protein HC773_16255 [Scytonema sp. CRU_2_7]|nr:hypothetical protein [Scytonema sp. CRU_2_7]
MLGFIKNLSEYSGSRLHEVHFSTSPRQMLQRREPQRQIPTEGNPPAVLAPQRTGSQPHPP